MPVSYTHLDVYKRQYQGGAEYSDQDLRTCNISLKDGRVYEVKDIIRLDDAFLAEWADIMRDEADNDAFLSELRCV